MRLGQEDYTRQNLREKNAYHGGQACCSNLVGGAWIGVACHHRVCPGQY